MTEQEEYEALLRNLPKGLSAEELTRFKTDYAIENARQMVVKATAVCRDGNWYGALIFIHRFGVVGHQVFSPALQFRDDARHVAAQVCERMQDYHEQLTGVRNRGAFDTDDDDPVLPCP